MAGVELEGGVISRVGAGVEELRAPARVIVFANQRRE